MDINDTDKKFMRRCVQLACKGTGLTYPNPMVGAVIVHKGRIIGEGYHVRAGEPHAEINALQRVKQGQLLPESTMYVSLEPCSHYGRTPPCARRIVEGGIRRVVIGTLDPNPQVTGKGVGIMEEAGIEVIQGVLEAEAQMLNRRFFTSQQQQRPYVILKWAQTLDGFIDLERAPDAPVQPNWITNEVARVNVHKWRAREQAIMVGTNTARKDNPKLNVRHWHGSHPTRIVLDKALDLPETLDLFDGSIPTLVYNARKNEIQGKINYRYIDFNRSYKEILQAILTDLHQQGIQSLFTEGGATLINTFVSSGLWDEARVFIGNTFFRKGVKAPSLKNGTLKREEYFGHSKLFVYSNDEN